jgi:Na+/melibiose symporter-like transporter
MFYSPSSHDEFSYRLVFCFVNFLFKYSYLSGSVHINHLNGPGFLMTVIWFILQIVCWFCFHDRTPETTTGPSTVNGHVTNDSPKHKYTRSDHQLKKEEQQSLSLKTYRDQYIRAEMFVLFLATFITYFNQTALETIVAAFTEKHFKWTTVHTSILFAFAGLEIIIVYIVLVKIFSKRFEDRMLLILGFVSLTFACILGVFFTWASHSFGWSTADTIDKRLLVMFIIFVFLDLLGLPFIAATSVSLFTKLTIKELQGFSQGVQRFIMGIGTIGKI